MHRILLVTPAMAGLFAVVALNAWAAPSSGLSGVHAVSIQDKVIEVDYYWNHYHYHHRRWHHHHWHYW